MRNKIFLDTSGLIAMLNLEEDFHLNALKVFEDLDSSGCVFFTTEYILEELYTWMRCRKRVPVEVIFKFVHALYLNDLEVVEIGRDRFGKSLAIMCKYRDHFFSLTDCVSFLVMNEFKIDEAFTTDKHFQIAGFRKLL